MFNLSVRHLNYQLHSYYQLSAATYGLIILQEGTKGAEELLYHPPLSRTLQRLSSGIIDVLVSSLCVSVSVGYNLTLD